MEPRYQVFISSTFRDLKAERQAALGAVLDLGHFPAGMEAFPAASATPWELIEKIISESDYYVLIIGGRYGSVSDSGVSYTEREYDLAQVRGVPTLAFVHSNPGLIAAQDTDSEPRARKRLTAFRKKVEGNHHIKTWNSALELKANIVLALTHEIRVNPRVGWIRGNDRDSLETLKRLNLLFEENDRLKTEIDQLRQLNIDQQSVEDKFAHENELISVRFNGGAASMSWRDIFLLLAPMMTKRCEEDRLTQVLARKAVELSTENVARNDHHKIVLNQEDWKLVVLQFLALRYWENVEWRATENASVFGLRSARGTPPVEVAKTGLKLTDAGIRRFAERKAMLKLSAIES